MSQTKTILKWAAAGLVWLLTIGLSIVDVYFVRQVFFGLYARVLTDPEPAVLAGDIVVVLAAIGALAFIVGTSEYHRKHLGSHASWDVFAWSLVGLLAIPFLATVVV